MNASTFRTVAAIVAAQMVVLALVLFVRGGGEKPLEAFTGSDGYLVITVLATETGPGPYLGSTERSAMGASSGEIADRRDAAGTFGGYEGELAQTCDTALLARFVTAVNPDRGATWATAQGMRSSDADSFIKTLVPAVLVAPTLATYHALDGSRDVAEEVVLESGTAVLVDSEGNPRVRCLSGSPITPARAVGASDGGSAPAASPTAPPPTPSETPTPTTQEG